jgi:hypothetical protein
MLVTIPNMVNNTIRKRTTAVPSAGTVRFVDTLVFASAFQECDDSAWLEDGIGLFVGVLYIKLKDNN